MWFAEPMQLAASLIDIEIASGHRRLVTISLAKFHLTASVSKFLTHRSPGLAPCSKQWCETKIPNRSQNCGSRSAAKLAMEPV